MTGDVPAWVVWFVITANVIVLGMGLVALVSVWRTQRQTRRYLDKWKR